jgi:hypothetical protein
MSNEEQNGNFAKPMLRSGGIENTKFQSEVA